MELLLKRIARKPNYTIGKLYIDGKYFCDTLEDTDRGLRQDLPASVNKAMKRKSATAIPTGKYQITLGVRSPKFSKKKAYDFCGGCLPRLLNVPAFEGVLIHAGNTSSDTDGCLLVGRNRQVGKVLDSLATFKALYAELNKSTGIIFIKIE